MNRGMKGTWKKMVSGVCCALLCAGFMAGCGSDTAKNSQSSGGKIKVEVVAKGFQHDFWKAVRMGAEKAGAEMNADVNFVGPDNESAVAQQVEMIKNAVNKHPAAICLAALDTKACMDVLAQAKAAKIPIIGFDSGVPGAPAGSIVANAATDNYNAGEIAAQHMMDAIQPKLQAAASGSAVRIGVVAQESNSDSINKRTGGFVDKIVSLIEAQPGFGKGSVAVIGHDKYANGVTSGKVIIEVRIPSEVSDNAGKTEASTLLNKGDLIAIYGSNEFAAKCIINADETLKKLGPNKVIAIGFDSGALQLNAIRSGVFYGSITQDPVQIGYQAVKLAIAAQKGETVKDVDTGCRWYDAKNMSDPEIAPCLYE